MAWRITLAASALSERRRDGLVELVGFTTPLVEQRVERLAERLALLFTDAAREPQANHRRLACADVDLVVRRDLGALLLGIHRVLAAVDHEVVDAVLDVRALVLLPGEEPFVVGFVLGEEQRHVAVARQHERTQQRMRGGDRGGAGRPLDLLQVRLFGRPVRRGNPPRPVVAEPQRRQEVQVGRVRSAVGRGDLHQDVVGRALGVLDEHVEVPVVVEDAGIEQLVLHVVARALAVRPYKVAVGIGRLRVLVEILHVRVGRRAIEVEVVLLHVLAVVALAVGQPEEPLLEDRDPCRSTGPG